MSATKSPVSADEAGVSAASSGPDARRDTWLMVAGFAGLAGLAAALWFVNGESVFASLITGLWAMCF